MTKQAPWTLTVSLQNFEKMNFYCLNHPVYAILFVNLSKTKTVDNPTH